MNSKLYNLLFLGFLFIWTTGQASNDSLSHYFNARFNYEVSYPKFLIPQGEPTNGDGQKFLGNDADLTVWGSFFPNLESQKDENNYSISDEFNFEKKELQSTGYNLGYTVLKGNFFVITAANQTKIIYIKKIDVSHCGIHIYLKLTYPKSAKSYWDPLVTKISHSFKYHSATCEGDYRT